MTALTHVIAGCAIASTVMKGRGRPTLPEGVAILCGAAASAFPDIDILDRPFGDSAAVQGLSYLLYHRGITHTVPVCLALAALTVVIILGLGAAIARGAPSERWHPAASRLLLIASLGALLHLAMDATNDYGVHPFWPLWNGWIYGDFIFLAEPLVGGALLSLALRPLLRDWGLPGRRNWIPTIVALAGMVAFILLIWSNVAQKKAPQNVATPDDVTVIKWITGLGATIASVWILSLLAWERYRPSLRRPWVCLVGVWVVFLVCSQLVKGEVSALLLEKAPGERTIALVTTPAPANPFCWRVVTSGVSATGEVRTRIGVVSLWKAVKADTCYVAMQPGTAELQKLTGLEGASERHPERDPERYHWIGMFSAPLSTFRGFAANDCRVTAATHFLRAPFWQNMPTVCPSGGALLGDLRVDYKPGLGDFCKFCFDPTPCPNPKLKPKDTAECDLRVPPWHRPFFDPAKGAGI